MCGYPPVMKALSGSPALTRNKKHVHWSQLCKSEPSLSERNHLVGCWLLWGEGGGEGNRYYRLKPRSHTFLGSKNATLNLTSMTTANLLHAGQKSLQHFPPKYFAAFPPLLTGCFPQKRPREALQSLVLALALCF